MPPVPRTIGAVKALAAERIRALLALPLPPPILHSGGSAREIAALLALDADPVPGTKLERVDTGLDVENATYLACQSLTRMAVLERVTGIPIRYRAVRREGT